MNTVTQKRPVNNNLLVLKGSLAIIWGIMALIFAAANKELLILSFGLLNLLACGLTLIHIIQHQHLKIAHQWLVLEGIIESAAAIVFLFFTNSTAEFLEYLCYGILFIVILQFIYGFFLVQANILNLKNMIARFISLLAGCVIAVGIFGSFIDHTGAFIVIGIFSIIFGILNVQFAYKLSNIILGKTK